MRARPPCASERLAWALMGAGIVELDRGGHLWTVVLNTRRSPDAPYPSVADALCLALYAASYVVLVLLVRSRLQSVPHEPLARRRDRRR